jgi:hypothetical protein
MEDDMKFVGKTFVAAAIILSAGTVSAYADSCSGHSHDTGTALGAGGGALIGGLASHSIGGAIIGGVAGGFAGNALARSQDCGRLHYYTDRDGHRHYYRR